MLSTTSNLIKYAGNDSTTVFPFNFLIHDEGDLTVIVADADDNQTPLVLNTDYTVSGVGDESGGNVTYTGGGTPLPTGSSITIYRDVALTQLTDLQNQQAYHPETLEDRLDYLTMICQQLQEQVDRAWLVSVTSGTTPTGELVTDLWDGDKLYLDKANYPTTYITLDAGVYSFWKAGEEVFRI